MLIIIARSDFNGSPLFLNGRRFIITPDTAIEVGNDYLSILTAAGIPFAEVPLGAATGRSTIPKGNGPRVSVSINGRIAYFATGTPLTLTEDVKSVLLSAGIVLIPERAIVAGVPTLAPLSFGGLPTSLTIGTLLSGTILGTTIGSAIAATPLATGFTINGAARTWAYDGTGGAATTATVLTETLAGAVGSPRASNASVTVAAAGALSSNRFGMNAIGGFYYTTTAQYNNLARTGDVRDSASSPLYRANEIDEYGNVLQMRPGLDTFVFLPRPGPLTTYRLLATWTGAAVMTEAQGSAANIISQSPGRAVFNYTCPADSELGITTGCKWGYTAAVNPLMNLDVRIVDGSDVPLNPGTFEANYINRLSECGGALRFLATEGGSVLGHCAWTGPLTWAKRTKVTASRPVNKYWDQASLTVGSGSSQLIFKAMLSWQIPYKSAVFNGGIDQARTLAFLGMANGTGAQGNNISITILAASGTGSFTIAKDGLDVNIVVTPATTGQRAANIANLLNYTPAPINGAAAKGLFYTDGGELSRLTFTGQPAVNSTITVGGTIFTFVASEATGSQVNIGASMTASILNLSAKIVSTLTNTRISTIGDNRLDVGFLSGADQTIVCSGPSTATVVLATGSGTVGTLAKTYLSGGTDPITIEGFGITRELEICTAANIGMRPIFPCNASVDYITNSLILMRDSLPSHLKVHPAVCNEIWNFADAYYGDQIYLAGLGLSVGGADPTNSSYFNATLHGYAWKYKQVMDIAKTVFAATPDRLVRTLEGLQSVPGAVTTVDLLLRRPAQGGNALLCCADHTDEMQFAPYHGEFGVAVTSQRNQWESGAAYAYGAHFYNADAGLGTVGVFFANIAHTTTTLAADIASGKVVPFTAENAETLMRGQVYASLTTAKTLTTAIHLHFNERGNRILAGNYEMGQSSIINSDAGGVALYNVAIPAFYRSPVWRRIEGEYLHGLAGPGGFAGQDGMAMHFNAFNNGKYVASGFGNWGSIESPYTPLANGPRLQALIDAVDGIYPAFYWPSAVPTIGGIFETGSSLTLTLPTAHNATSVMVQRTRNGVALGSPVEMVGQVSMMLPQTAADETTTINAVVTLSNAMGSVGSSAFTTLNITQSVAPLPIHADTTALLARMTVQPTANAAKGINAFIHGLDQDVFSAAASTWVTLGDIRITVAHTAQAQILNWKAASLAWTKNGNPSFTAFAGLVSTSATDYYSLGGNGMGDVPNYESRTAASHFAWLFNPSANTLLEGISQGSSTADSIATRQTAGSSLRLGIATSAPGSGSIESGTGTLLGITRINGTTVKTYLNGALVATVASTAAASEDLRPQGYLQTNSPGAVMKASFAGGLLNDAQIASLKTRLLNLLAILAT